MLDTRGDDPRPSVATLARNCALNHKTARRALHDLEAAGWLRIIFRKTPAGGSLTSAYELTCPTGGTPTSGTPPTPTSGSPPLPLVTPPPSPPVGPEVQQQDQHQEQKQVQQDADPRALGSGDRDAQPASRSGARTRDRPPASTTGTAAAAVGASISKTGAPEHYAAALAACRIAAGIDPDDVAEWVLTTAPPDLRNGRAYIAAVHRDEGGITGVITAWLAGPRHPPARRAKPRSRNFANPADQSVYDQE